MAAFRAAIRRLRVGDTVRVVVRRGAKQIEQPLVVAAYERRGVRICVGPDAMPGQRALFAR